MAEYDVYLDGQEWPFDSAEYFDVAVNGAMTTFEAYDRKKSVKVLHGGEPVVSFMPKVEHYDDQN
jgi:hypothetical protein